MQPLTQEIVTHGYQNRVITAKQLDRILSGSANRRYGLVNRALNNHELLQVKRGIYVLPSELRSQPLHPFTVAQSLAPCSYVSFETALSYHGWIPERTGSISSVIPGRKAYNYSPKWSGSFTFSPLAIQRGHFLELVSRVLLNGQVMLIATPSRALLDLVCLLKITWQGIEWLTEGLRIEPEQLQTITGKELEILVKIYKHKRVRNFIHSMTVEL